MAGRSQSTEFDGRVVTDSCAERFVTMTKELKPPLNPTTRQELPVVRRRRGTSLPGFGRVSLGAAVFACLGLAIMALAVPLGGTHKVTGADCFNGVNCTTQPCPGGICGNKLTTLACYACCNANGCDGSNDSGWCQTLCQQRAIAELARLGVSDDFLNSYDLADGVLQGLVNGYLQQGRNLSISEVITVELIIGVLGDCGARGQADASLALALLLEADWQGRIDSVESAKVDELIGEIHHSTLFAVGDCPLRRTARHLGAVYGIRGNRDPREDRSLLIAQIAAEGLCQDPNLLQLYLRN